MNPEDQNDRRPELDRATEAAADLAAPIEDGARTEPGRTGAVDVQAYIGRQLRAVYEDVARQPIPDRFLALMKQLEERSVD